MTAILVNRGGRWPFEHVHFSVPVSLAKHASIKEMIAEQNRDA